MSSSAIYADSFSAYRNPGSINNAIQSKIDNVAENELLFGNVDYSGSYEGILQNYANSLGNSQTYEDVQDTGNNSSSNEVDNQDDAVDDDSLSSGELAQDGGTRASEEQIKQLKAAFADIKDEQGWLGNAWDGIKNFFGHQNGSNKVQDVISKAESGEISLEAAVEKLNTFATKQESFIDTFSNVASGLAVAAGVIAAPFSFGASLALGAGVGAAVKIGIKASDKATNNVEGDYTLNNGLKDAITGGIGGAVTAATAGIGTAGLVAAKEGGKVLVKETIKQGIVSGAKAGAIDGAVMGATNYTADAIFDGDEFSFGGFVGSTASGAIGGALVGGAVGGVTSGVSAVKYNNAVDATDVLNARDIDLNTQLQSLDNNDLSTMLSSKNDALQTINKQIDDLCDVKDLTSEQTKLLSQLKQQKSYLESDIAKLKNSTTIADYKEYLSTEQDILSNKITSNQKTISSLDASKVVSEADDEALNAVNKLKSGDSISQADVDNLVNTRNEIVAKIDSPDLTYSQKQIYKKQLQDYDSAINKLKKNGLIDDSYAVNKSTSVENTGTVKKPVYKQNGSLASTDTQRITVLRDKVKSNEIKTLQDAYDAGFTKVELQKSNLYNRLNSAKTQTTVAPEATTQTSANNTSTSDSAVSNLKAFGKNIKSTADDLFDSFTKGIKKTDLSPSKVKQMFTGKANATAKEFTDAYNAMKETDNYKTNLLFRTFVEDLFNIGNAE